MKKNVFLLSCLALLLQGCDPGETPNALQFQQSYSSQNIVQSNTTGTGADDFVLNEANALAGLDGLLQGDLAGIASADAQLGVTCQ